MSAEDGHPGRIPDGDYWFRCIGSEAFVKPGGTGRATVRLRLEVIDGPQAGRLVSHFYCPSHPPHAKHAANLDLPLTDERLADPIGRILFGNIRHSRSGDDVLTMTTIHAEQPPLRLNA